MADTEITLLATGTALHLADWLVYVDTTDATLAASGTDKKLSPAVLTAGLVPFAASGVSHAQGVVPDPGVSAGATRFLREDSSWAVPPGSGGAPGGTPGQIQYDNAGAFGGFTVSGDGTLVASTGVLTVTKTGGVAFAASATTDATNAANISSGTLPAARLPNPSAATLGGIESYAAVGSQWINAISVLGVPSSAQPAFSDLSGTLATAQVGAAQVTYPKIQNVAAFSFLGNPTGSAAAPSEITLAPNLAFNGTTLRGRAPLVWVAGSGTAVANSIALTSLFAGATLGGSLTIPANALQVGSMLQFALFGQWSGVNPVTLTMQISLGGTIVLQGTTNAITTQTGNGWGFDHIPSAGGLFVQAIGASGKVIGIDRANLLSGAGLQLSASGSANMLPAQVTVNTTGALALDIKVQWSVASVSNTIQLTGGAVYLDG